MNDRFLQDPLITRIEATGYPYPVRWPVCPVCGKECDTFYRQGRYGDIVGCDECIYQSDAWEDMEDEES